MHAQFTNSQEVYIIALSGTGYTPDITSPGKIKSKAATYNETWQMLSQHLKKKCPAIADIADKIVVAEFDAVHKACLAEHEGKIITDQKFFKEWVERLENWIGEWYRHYQSILKAKKGITIKQLVEEGMQETYFEQMKIEAPSEKEAKQRYKDITEFVTDCVPDYLPHDKRLADYKLPIRMRMVELLLTKSSDEIKEWFENELTSPYLSQHRKTFERLRQEFEFKEPYYLHVQNIKPLFEKLGEQKWIKYKKKYDEYNLPKGYTTASMIWGGYFPDGVKFSVGIVNFFIQCAEDNALCTLEHYVKQHNLKCRNVSWYAFQHKNNCKEGRCESSSCKHAKCKGKDYNCWRSEIKDPCAFCKVGFTNRVSNALDINKNNIHVEVTKVSDKSDEEENDHGHLLDYILSFEDITVSQETQQTEDTTQQTEDTISQDFYIDGIWFRVTKDIFPWSTPRFTQ